MPKIGQTTAAAKQQGLQPFWTTEDGDRVRLYHGDVLAVLRQMPARSVQCVVTSPPYWGLRSYLPTDHKDKYQELGSESTPQEFVAKMVGVFREVRRVLRDDGTLWLNLGDSYGARGGNIIGPAVGGSAGGKNTKLKELHDRMKGESTGLKSGNLVGVPWRVALALQADGWVLRQDIVWHKSAPMPESVRNRCTKSHEYVFLLTKGMKYFYDNDAIREPHREYNPSGRNKRSVWTVSSPVMKLREDLTPKQKAYVLAELVKRGLL